MNLKVPALEKLLEYAASGLGSVAGSILAPWQARQEAQAKVLAAEGNAKALVIQANAQSKAREILASSTTNVIGELDIADAVHQRLLFQEEKRQINIESVVKEAARQLDGKSVSNSEPDHDWTARFFNDVQDVSSEDMQNLWSRVLSGEVERAGTTSIRTLGILKNLDQSTAHLFKKFCSICVFLNPDGNIILDARVPSLGGNAASNSLKAHGLAFGALNRLNEHGLIISDYNSRMDYNLSIGIITSNPDHFIRVPFIFQGRRWVLVPKNQSKPKKEFKLSGVALNGSGRELSKIIELEPMEKFAKDLIEYFQKNNLQMTEVNGNEMQP